MKTFILRSLVLLAFIAVNCAVSAQEDVNAPPVLTQSNLDKWIHFIEAKDSELRWKNVRWHKDFEAAVIEARELKRPVLLWTMNGHPCGET